MLSDVMEDYLKAIFTLQEAEGPPVATSAISEHLDVTPPTVTSMMETLESKGLVTREKYKGVELTEEGNTVALEVIRHHRLIEAYLAEHLDYEWSEVHDEADVLEHHISEEFEERVASALGEPAYDPHGDPIPGADLEPVEDDTRSLSEYETGDEVVVCRVRDRDPDELGYLAEMGIEPGTRLLITEVAPIGMFRVEVGSQTRHLPESIATMVRVRPIEAEDEDQGIEVDDQPGRHNEVTNG